MKEIFKTIVFTGIGFISYRVKKVNKVLKEDVLEQITDKVAFLNFDEFEVVGLEEEEMKKELTKNN